MIFSLSNILKNHLQEIEKSIYLGLGIDDQMYQVGILYHYFTSSHQNYKQFDKGLTPLFQQEDQASELDAKKIKAFQIGIMASSSYLMLENIGTQKEKEQNLHFILEQNDLPDIITYFYQDIDFAINLIRTYLTSHYYTQEEQNDMRKELTITKERHLFELNPLLIGEDIEQKYQKRKH